MGASRICRRCLVRLVTNADHTRVWCPVCWQQFRLVNHSEESASRRSSRQPAAAHRTRTPSPPSALPSRPACAGPAAQAERPAAPVIAAPQRRSRTRMVVPALVVLFSLALVGGGSGLAFYYLGDLQQDRGDAQAPGRPAPVASKAPEPAAMGTQRPPKPPPPAPLMVDTPHNDGVDMRAPAEPGPVASKEPAPAPKAPAKPPKPAPHHYVTLKEVQQENLRAVLEQHGPPPTGDANALDASRRIDELVLAGLKAKGHPPGRPVLRRGVRPPRLPGRDRHAAHRRGGEAVPRGQGRRPAARC